MPFAVVVSFQIEAGHSEAFLPLILKNARSSVADEPGCHQFDVATDPARPDEVFLYEIYTDKAAFDTHRTMPHYHAFESAAGSMIIGKDVRTYATVAR